MKVVELQRALLQLRLHLRTNHAIASQLMLRALQAQCDSERAPHLASGVVVQIHFDAGPPCRRFSPVVHTQRRTNELSERCCAS